MTDYTISCKLSNRNGLCLLPWPVLALGRQHLGKATS